MNPELQAELQSELVRTLLQIALQDLVAIVRHAVAMNTMPGGQPTPSFDGPAAALERFDRLGGFEALCLELWRRSPVLDAVVRDRSGWDGIGQVAEVPPSRTSAQAQPDVSALVGIGRDRTGGRRPAEPAP